MSNFSDRVPDFVGKLHAHVTSFPRVLTHVRLLHCRREIQFRRVVADRETLGTNTFAKVQRFSARRGYDSDHL